MAGIKISALPTVVSTTITDIFPIVQGGITSRASIAQLLDTIGTEHICRVGSTAALTVTYSNGSSGVGATLTNAGALAALSIDGVALAIGNKVLIKDQASTFQNGVYEVTVIGSGAIPWVMTRDDGYDQVAEIDQGDFFTIGAGTTNAKTQWIQTEVVATIGVDAILFESNVVAGTGITKTNNTVALTVPVSMANGGTNKALTANNGGIVWTDANSMEVLAGTATAGQILLSGATATPAWSTPTYPSASGSAGQIIRSNGTNNVYSTSTFADTYTASNLLYSNGANTVTGLATANNGALVTSNTGVPSILGGPGTTGNILQSNAAAAPSFSTATYPATTTISQLLYSSSANVVAGLATANSASLVTNSTGVPVWSSSLTDGQLIIGSAGATPTPGTLTAGTGVSITNGAASITINSSGGGLTWTEVTGASAPMSVSNGYISSNAGLVTLTLPVTSAVGDVISIVGKGAGGWLIAQGAANQIQIGSSASTLGVGGSVASSNRYDSVNLVCVTANSIWVTVGGPQSAGLTIV